MRWPNFNKSPKSGITLFGAFRLKNEGGRCSRRSSVRLEHQTLMNDYTIDIWVSRVRASPLAYIFAKVGFNCFSLRTMNKPDFGLFHRNCGAVAVAVGKIQINVHYLLVRCLLYRI